jgi:hypothetical protein
MLNILQDNVRLADQSIYTAYAGFCSVDELRINYWGFMITHPSHRRLPKRAENAAREVLNFFLAGEYPNILFTQRIFDILGLIEGLRRKSDSRAPLSLEECRQLLDYLDQSSRIDPPVRADPTNYPGFSQSTARTHLLSWILLHAGLPSCRLFFAAHPNLVLASLSSQNNILWSKDIPRTLGCTGACADIKPAVCCGVLLLLWGTIHPQEACHDCSAQLGAPR